LLRKGQPLLHPHRVLNGDALGPHFARLPHGCGRAPVHLPQNGACVANSERSLASAVQCDALSRLERSVYLSLSIDDGGYPDWPLSFKIELDDSR
jgi:hypothetical protein